MPDRAQETSARKVAATPPPARAVAEPGEAGWGPVERILELQSTVGNQQVAGVLARNGATATDPATTPAAAPSTDAEAIATEIYDALAWVNDVPRALAALSNRDVGTRFRIKSAFRKKYDVELSSYLKDQLDEDSVVKAFALLESTNVHEPHTALALALIPLGTRDAEIFRILEGATLTGRKAIELRYDQTFGQLGTGSLQSDLRDDLSGWALEKSLALLDRDLTQADHLYFSSVAIAGTHTESVVQLIQSAWAQGPAEFAKLEQDWNTYVRNQGGWTDTAWTDMSLEDAMSDELSGEEWELVKAVLDGYKRLREAPGGLDPARLAGDPAVDDVELQVAEDSLRAATTGGHTGAGTNEAQVFTAVERIRTVWERRIERAEEPLKAQLRSQWEERRKELLGQVSEEMNPGTADYKRSRLLLSGSLTPADEVYLASLEFDNGKVVGLLKKYWAAGQMDEIIEQAEQPKREGSQELRPMFELWHTVPVTSGGPFDRVLALTDRRMDDATRGADALKLELDEGNDDSDLRKAYELLEPAEALRDAVLATFAERHLAAVEGETPAKKFLTYITARYESSTTVWDFTDKLDPASGGAELVRRAEGRLAASKSGVFDFELERWIRDYDAITGEDTIQVADESLERLRFIATRAKPEELAAIAAMTGKKKDELAQMEYAQFVERLAEVEALKHAIAEALATAAELAISAVISIATGGAASGLFVAALSSAIAGMILRETLLGQKYDLLSKENAAKLAVIVAGAGFGALGGELFRGVVDAEKLAKLGRVGAFLEEATTEAFSQIGGATIGAAFSDRLPGAEEIAAGAFSIVAGSLAAGTKGSIKFGLEDSAALSERVRRTFIANLTSSTMSGMSEQTADFMKTGFGDLSAPEILTKYGEKGASAFQTSLFSTVSDIGAHEVAAARERAAADEKSGDEGESTPPVDPAAATGATASEATEPAPTEAAVRAKIDELRAEYGPVATNPEAFERTLAELERMAKKNPTGAMEAVDAVQRLAAARDLETHFDEAGRQASPEDKALHHEEGEEPPEALTESDTKHQRTRESGRASAELEAAMAAKGDPCPPGHDTHHIVAWNDPRAAVARSVLEDAEIDPRNDPDNGIHLPRTSMNPETTPDAATRHQTIHTDAYYKELTLRLIEAKHSGTVVETLGAIRREIANGQFFAPGKDGTKGETFAQFLLDHETDFDWLTPDEIAAVVEAAKRKPRARR